jgi:hypothetical protein
MPKKTGAPVKKLLLQLPLWKDEMETQKPELAWIDDRCFVVSLPDPEPDIGSDIAIVHLYDEPVGSKPWTEAQRNEFARRVLDAYRSVRVPAGETLAEAVDKILAQEGQPQEQPPTRVDVEDVYEGPRMVRHRSDTYDPNRHFTGGKKG